MTFLASVLAYVVSGGGRFVSVTLERLAALPALWVFVAGSRQRPGDSSCRRYGRSIQKPGLANLTARQTGGQIRLIRAKFTGSVDIEFNLPD